MIPVFTLGLVLIHVPGTEVEEDVVAYSVTARGGMRIAEKKELQRRDLHSQHVPPHPTQGHCCAGGKAQKPSSSIWESKKASGDFWSRGSGKTNTVQSLSRLQGPDKHPRLSLTILGNSRNNKGMYNRKTMRGKTE